LSGTRLSPSVTVLCRCVCQCRLGSWARLLGATTDGPFEVNGFMHKSIKNVPSDFWPDELIWAPTNRSAPKATFWSHPSH